MTKSERRTFFAQMMWDASITSQEVEEIFSGEKSQVGNYNKEALFKRILESYSWFTILQLFTPQQIKELLTDDIIRKIRSASLRRQYEFARKRLQQII